MSENKGTYVFDHKLLNRRLEVLKNTQPSEKDAIIKGLIEVSDQVTAIAETLTARATTKPIYTDEDVRELARHLNAVIKAFDMDYRPSMQTATVNEAREFLRSKKYFNVNQSDLIV